MHSQSMTALPAALGKPTRRRIHGDWRMQEQARWPGIAFVAVGHVAAVAALLQIDSVRQTVAQAAPIFVDFIAPERQPVPEPPAPPPPKIVPKKEPPPLLAAIQPEPKPAEFIAPPPPPEPVVATPLVEAAPPAPAAPPATPAQKVVTNVEYVRKPQLEYPAASRRMNEQGKVLLRVLIDRKGTAERVEVQTSSGSRRLDEAAIKAARDALYRPYAENGLPVSVWALVPAVFELSE